MKAVILAGGLGTRLSEETSVRPKPMVEVGSQPILWHILKIYSSHGINDFVVCCGYKGEVIKDYFVNYVMRHSDLTVDVKRNEIELIDGVREPWRVTLVDTGQSTMTGGRLLRVREHLNDETFCMTYGDGLGDIDISDLIAFHKQSGSSATLTAVQPPGRFGAFTLADDETMISSFREKPSGEGAWISGGYFVLEPTVFDYLSDDSTVWEREPLTKLAHDGKLGAYKHDGFWQPMDTLREKTYLEELWDSGEAPWKLWD